MVLTPSPALAGPALYRRLRERVLWDLPASTLAEQVVSRGEGLLTAAGAVAVSTGEFTGRSPGDKFTVRRPPSSEHLDWSSRFNQEFATGDAERQVERFVQAAAERPVLYGFRGYVGRGEHRLPIAIIAERAWHALMARHLFVAPGDDEGDRADPCFTLLVLPTLGAEPGRDGARSGTLILCDFEHGLGLIGGTEYGGELKKFFFYVLNYLLPLRDVLPMHCAANLGQGGDTCLLFGLSGTGKTTLSADPARRLLGDDEHGWSASGVFNFEGGCYAKVTRLSREGEPLIWRAVNRPYSVLENVPVRGGEPDFQCTAVENTRGAYPLAALDNVEHSGSAGHPSTIAYLAYDATGTLPPLSVLTVPQALYWFLAGYTARVAGTERGMGAMPEPTFSACFGAPFLPWSPARYLELLQARLRQHRPLVVLLNTGHAGGAMGGAGRRLPLELTRTLLRAAQSGALRQAALHPHPEYGVLVPENCPGVPRELLQPRLRWRDGDEAYHRAAEHLVAAFRSRVTERYRGLVPPEVLAAAPGE